jgi:hypothetical protein
VNVALRRPIERVAAGLKLSARRLRLPDGVQVNRSDAARALEDWLYERFFIDWRAPAGRFSDSVGGAPHFTAQLVDAAGAASWFDDRFHLVSRHRTGAFVENGVIRLFVRDSRDLRPPRAASGRRVAVRLPCARESAMAGFFCINSRTGRLPDDAPHLKVYLNLKPSLAPGLLRGLLHEASLRGARFDAKVVNDPDAFGRRDTALLYVAPGSIAPVLRFVARLHRSNRSGFRPAIPPFVLPLAPGIGLAESPPGDEESFGGQRCRLTALGLLDWLDGKAPTAWSGVATQFEQQGLDASQPWLGVLPSAWVARARSVMRPAARR